MATKSLLGPHTSAFPKAKCAPALGCPGPGCPEEHGVCHHRGLAMSLLLRLRLGPCSLSCGYLWLFGTLPPPTTGNRPGSHGPVPAWLPSSPAPVCTPCSPRAHTDPVGLLVLSPGPDIDRIPSSRCLPLGQGWWVMSPGLTERKRRKKEGHREGRRGCAGPRDRCPGRWCEHLWSEAAPFGQ